MSVLTTNVVKLRNTEPLHIKQPLEFHIMSSTSVLHNTYALDMMCDHSSLIRGTSIH